MTDSYARPRDDSGDATIPIVPDAGYAPTEHLPFVEETLVDPAGRSGSLWSADSGLDLSAPGYGETYSSQPPAAPAPQASYPPPSLYPTPAAYTSSSYSQPQTGYGQPAAQTNYVQPQVAPQQPYRPTATRGFAEPSGVADTIGPQNIYQGYPTAPTTQPAQQQPAWPAVIQDPVGYDYGYSNPANLSEHPNAVLSLVLGLIGLFFFQLLSPVAWYLAAKGRREMAAFPGRWRPSGSLTAGLVLGIIGTVFLGLAVAFIVGMIMLMIASTGG